MDIKQKLWARIKELRLTAELSQETLASRAKIHRDYMWLVERGQKNIWIENLERIAKALKIKLKDLFDF